MSNSIQIVDREIATGSIEGTNFGGSKGVWVVARSPTAVLIWVFGHSWSVNGHQSYSQPKLVLLPDRTPTVLLRGIRYKNLPYQFNRLIARKLALDSETVAILIDTFGANALPPILKAIQQKQTTLIDGGAGSLQPLHCYADAYREWKDRGGGFVVLPEGMSEWDACRGKLGWKPRDHSAGS